MRVLEYKPGRETGVGRKNCSSLIMSDSIYESLVFVFSLPSFLVHDVLSYLPQIDIRDPIVGLVVSMSDY